MNEFSRNRLAFLSRATAVLTGSVPSNIAEIDTTEAAKPAADWTDEDWAILLDEGRRHFDASAAAMETIRGRAQITFTTALLLLSALAAQWHKVSAHSSWIRWLLLGIGLLLALLGTAGALGVWIVPVRGPLVHPARVTGYGRPVSREVALKYAGLAGLSNQVNGTLIGVLREAALYLTIGVILFGALWGVLNR